MQLHSGSTDISPESLLSLARCSVLKPLAGVRGEYLVLLQGYGGGGGKRFRLDCQKGNSEEGHPRRGRLGKSHQRKWRLEGKGWETSPWIKKKKKEGTG